MTYRELNALINALEVIVNQIERKADPAMIEKVRQAYGPLLAVLEEEEVQLGTSEQLDMAERRRWRREVAV